MKDKKYWAKLVAGLCVVFALFQWSASVLGSDLGQAGLLVGLLVVAATLVVDRIFFSPSFTASAQGLGLGLPTGRGLIAVVAVCGMLLLVIPVFALINHSSVSMRPKSIWLVPGLFAQAGIAEEVLFRGYLFGHIRQHYPFWRAAALAAIPFTAVHLFMFLTLPWPVAATAVFLAVILSFPLAHLFELGGRTIWAPAFLHFSVQGAIKVVMISDESRLILPFVWMAASAVIPFLVFLVPRPAELRSQLN